jgi:nucleotide-binding universal stress UspA family protein
MTPPAVARGLFRSILCPVDFSSHSRAALQHAAAIARRSGGQLTALFASDPLLVAAAAAAAYDRAALEQTSETELRDFVRRAIGSSVKPSQIACSVVQGDAADEIGKAVKRLSADLVVIGTQGLSGASKWFFGSTTERVLRRATTPVLTVPPATTGRRMPASWPGKRVLAAVDLGPHTAADVRAAADVARWADARLVLVHVLRPTQAPRWLSTRLQAHERARLQNARTRLERIARDLDAAQPVDCQVLLGEPGDQIPAVATGSATGLVVVTLRGAGGFFGAPQGSTTYRVLGTATVPVLALPAHWKP